jgi:speckle-type POZ protein
VNQIVSKDDCFTVRCDLTVVKDVSVKATGQSAVVVPPSDLHRDLGELLSPGEGADVTFEVSGLLFRAHRNVLAARSSVFRAELYGPMKEKMVERVPIGDMEPAVFSSLLHFIYTDSVPDATGEEAGEETVMAQHLFVAADR